MPLVSVDTAGTPFWTLSISEYVRLPFMYQLTLAVSGLNESGSLTVNVQLRLVRKLGVAGSIEITEAFGAILLMIVMLTLGERTVLTFAG